MYTLLLSQYNQLRLTSNHNIISSGSQAQYSMNVLVCLFPNNLPEAPGRPNSCLHMYMAGYMYVQKLVGLLLVVNCHEWQ